MFTGIIEATGIVTQKKTDKNGLRLTIRSSVRSARIGSSVAVNGACLTVTKKSAGTLTFFVMKETLKRTCFADIAEGSLVNLERPLPANGRFDGHIVLGHVDTVARLTDVRAEKDGSRLLTFSLKQKSPLIIPKGSVTIDGISLTVVSAKKNGFTVGIIPFTWENTNLKVLGKGKGVNVEFDIIGKYVASLIS